MTKPNPSDTNAVGGAHPGTLTPQELELQLQFTNETSETLVRTDDSLGALAKRVIGTAEWKLNTFADTNTSPKYAYSPFVSFFAGGTVSSTPDGEFTVSDSSVESNNATFTVSKQDSKLTSTTSQTQVGTLDINTRDGHELNALSPIFPSTNYSPVKPWVKTLFPYFIFKKGNTLLVLDLVVKGLIALIDKQLDNKGTTSENITRKEPQRDVALIIQDNQEIETELFNRST